MENDHLDASPQISLTKRDLNWTRVLDSVQIRRMVELNEKERRAKDKLFLKGTKVIVYQLQRSNSHKIAIT